MQIEELKLSVRTYNCLKRARVNTVEELSTMADEDLLRFRNFGPKCLAEVRTVIAMPRKSRADRMREMTDEELAEYWYNNYDGFCSNKPECGRIIDAGGELDERECKGCVLAWLRMPMEESR